MAEIRLVLDNIRSVHNTGSIFRTAETLSVAKVYCLGSTPAPIDRFGRLRQDFAKVSLGSEKILDWEYFLDGQKLIDRLKKEGFLVIALEQSANSIDYKKVELKQKTVVIVGNEVKGVSEGLLAKADIVAEIPHSGHKESLNVAVATGVFLYRLVDR